MLPLSIIKSTGIYTTSSIINKGIPFFLLPVMTRFLSPDDYGILAIAVVLQGFITPFIGLNTSSAILRKYFEPGANIPRYIFNCLLLWISSSFLIFIVLQAGGNFIETLLSFPSSWLWGIWVVASCQYVVELSLSLLQMQEKPLRFSLLEISRTLLTVSLTLWLVVGLAMNWEGRILANIFTETFFLGVGLILITAAPGLDFRWDSSSVKHAIRFSLPLIPHTICNLLITMVDRLFIVKMVSVAEAGLYAAGYQFGMVISFLDTSFSRAYLPWLYRLMSERPPGYRHRLVTFIYSLFIGILLFTLLLSVTAPSVIDVFLGSRFQNAGQFVFWIALAYAFNAIYRLFTAFIAFAEKTRYLPCITATTLLMNIALNYILILQNGAVGAAQATTITYGIKLVLTWAITAKVYPLPWKSLEIKTSHRS